MPPIGHIQHERESHEPLVDLPPPVCIHVVHLQPGIAHTRMHRGLSYSRPVNSTRTYRGQRLPWLPVGFGVVIDQHLRVGESCWGNGYRNSGTLYPKLFRDATSGLVTL